MSFLSTNLFSQNCFADLPATVEKYEKDGMEFPENNFRALRELKGCDAPAFNALTLTGDSIKSSELKGKVVMVNFWFTTCPPCIDEMPLFNKIARMYDENDIVFISFCRNDESTIKEFLDTHEFDFKIVPNALPIAREFGVEYNGWPLTYILDKEGRISFVMLGFHPRQYDELLAEIERALSH